jgi:CobQ-like glutamine amidotransferase family enzyme
MYEINICYLYPDILNLYSDIGNIIALSKRCEWRGITCNIHNITLGDNYMPENYDITFMGSGQIKERDIVYKDIVANKFSEIANAIENNKVFLCINTSYQLLGNYYKTSDGTEIELLQLINFWSVEKDTRSVGNLIFECDFLMSENFDGKIVGFENHLANTYLGSGVTPLGKVLYGHGNNGEDGLEGAIYKNTFCSYSHGSLLPKNPALTDYLITLALKEKYQDFISLQILKDETEIQARNSLMSRFL